MECGLTIRDMRSISLGMAINIISEKKRRDKIRNGIEVSDPEAEYKRLKENEKMIDSLYEQKKISKEKYNAFKKSIADWENG